MLIKRYNNDLNSEETEYSKYELIHRILMSASRYRYQVSFVTHLHIYFLHVHIKNLSFIEFSENFKIAIFQIFEQKKKRNRDKKFEK